MLEKKYSRAAVAVMSDTFDEWMSDYSPDGSLPAVLERAKLYHYPTVGPGLIVVAWSVEDANGNPTNGVQGDKEILDWLNSGEYMCRVPHRVIIWGGDYKDYDETHSLDPELKDEFKRCFVDYRLDKLSPDIGDMHNVREYLSRRDALARENAKYDEMLAAQEYEDMTAAKEKAQG